MDTNALKKFAQSARNLAIDQVTAKLALVLDPSSPVRREHAAAIKKLDAAIAQNGKQQVIEQVAYTWFNRFTALRFMDANGYTNPRVVSPADGATRPEILSEALAGNLPDGAPDAIAALLSGRTPSNDPQAEAYRLLLVHACNQWHGPMPFLFEQIDDFTELLMPEDLLSQTSILAELRKVMTEGACQDVEIIGWLYQFYISEKKDQVFAGLKKNVKITAENIPAATQLFTPHWIVRYLVENSLGRLWLLNRPASTLASRMDYYIAPPESDNVAETDFLRITRVEDIRICDPACGSGHMLTYAFDLLYAIYEEEGYEADTIPALILTHNLTGVEIDDRAGALAAFALAMKAAARLGRRRFLRMGVTPNICVLAPSGLAYIDVRGVLTKAGVIGLDSHLSGANRRSVSTWIEEAALSLRYYEGELAKSSDADRAMKVHAALCADLQEIIEFYDEVSSRPDMVDALRDSMHMLRVYQVNLGSSDPFYDALDKFKRQTKAARTVRRLENLLAAAIKAKGYTAEVDAQVGRFQAMVLQASRHQPDDAAISDLMGRIEGEFDLLARVWADVTQFEQAKNFGSLIVPKLRDPAEALRVVSARDFAGDLLLKDMQARLVAVLRMAEALSPKYHVVVANPPYMGRGSMNAILMKWTENNYSDAKADLFAMFMSRSIILNRNRGFMAMINMQSWMFLSSFEKLRSWLLSSAHLVSMAHLGERAFDTIGGSVVSTTAFVFEKTRNVSDPGTFVRLIDGRNEEEKRQGLVAAAAGEKHRCYEASTIEFERIPGSPIAYWISDVVADAFLDEKLNSVGMTRRGLQTGNKESFIREWSEVDASRGDWTSGDQATALKSPATWFRFNNGGDYRKWSGGMDLVVNWKGNGKDIKATGKAIVPSEELYFKEAVCWGRISSGPEAYRLHDGGLMPGDLSPCYYSDEPLFALGYFNSPVARSFKGVVNPTITNTVGDLAKIPAPSRAMGRAPEIIPKSNRLIEIAKTDWDAFETSWDFTTLSLLHLDHRAETMERTYTTLRTHWQGMTDEMQRLEEENNRIFIDAYGLQDELTPEVPLNEITLTCNPAYRYGGNAGIADRETRLRADTVAEFLSYAVGCMFGRYSLDAPGLILANQGETLADYLARIPNPSFTPDKDNVIPMLDADWFADDITDRFRQFLRVSFGEDTFRENLRFIEDALGKDIRKYFTKDFYADHVKRYKKRPIYWQFASPKGSFQALIYMHRYRPDTVSVLLNEYLRAYLSKLEAERARLDQLADDASASQAQRTKALKDASAIAKQLDELNEWEREVVFPLAQQKIEIDLDAGVKVNYPLFGAALKKIPGLEATVE